MVLKNWVNALPRLREISQGVLKPRVSGKGIKARVRNRREGFKLKATYFCPVTLASAWVLVFRGEQRKESESTSKLVCSSSLEEVCGLGAEPKEAPGSLGSQTKSNNLLIFYQQFSKATFSRVG